MAKKVAEETRLYSYGTQAGATANLRAISATFTMEFSKRILEGKLSKEMRCGFQLHFGPLLQKPWFSRMWIRQEVGYASNALIICGDEEVDWLDLHWLMTFVVTMSAVGGHGLPAEKLHGISSYGHTTSLLDLLIESRELECSDPRDKVFALLTHPSAWEERIPDGLKDYCTGVLQKISDSASQEEVASELRKARFELAKDIPMVFGLWDTISERKRRDIPTSSGDQAVEEPHTTTENKSMLQQHATAISPSGYPLSTQPGFVNLFILILVLAVVFYIDIEYSFWLRPRLETANNLDVPLSKDQMQQMGHLMSQQRRLSELENPRLHPIYRVTSCSTVFCAFSSPIMKPDYSESVDQINYKLAVNLLRMTNSLKILSTVQHDPRKKKLEDIETTWVPHWDGPNIHSHLGRVSDNFQPWTSVQKMHINVANKILTLPGITFDTISSSTNPIRERTALDSQACMSLWKAIIKCDLSSRFLSDMQKLETYRRTLTVNNPNYRTLIAQYKKYSEKELHDSFAAFWWELYHRDQADEGNVIEPKIFPVPEIEDAAKRGERGEFWKLALSTSRNRRVFSTESGFLGLGPEILQPGDVVCITVASVPLVLRPVNKHFLLVGECYVDGIMNGEAMDTTKIQNLEIR